MRTPWFVKYAVAATVVLSLFVVLNIGSSELQEQSTTTQNKPNTTNPQPHHNNMQNEKMQATLKQNPPNQQPENNQRQHEEHQETINNADSQHQSIPPTIAYMSQGPASSFEGIWGRLKHLRQVQFYYHTFDTPYVPNTTALEEGINKPVSLFKQKTTFAQGRHILLRRALKDQERLNITYYAFFDDDVHMLCGDQLKRARRQNANEDSERQCWQQYTNVLLNSSLTDGWPLQRPGYHSTDMVDVLSIKWQTCVDANFQASHRDYLWLQSPASYKFQNETWWVKGQARHAIGKRCFPHLWRVDNRYMITNPEHRAYPKGGHNNILNEYMDYTFGPLGPWDDAMIKKYIGKHRCQVSSTPPPSKEVPDQLCRHTLQNRFDAWRNGTFEPDLMMDENATEY